MAADDEITRLRNWRHQMDKVVAGYGMRLESLEGRMAKVEPQVEKMARADEIAAALRSNLWTTAQKTGAAIVATIIGVTAILGVVLQILYH